MARPQQQSQRSYERQTKYQFDAAIAAANGIPSVISIEHHAQVYNGLPLVDPLLFGAALAGWGALVMFGAGRLAEYAAQASSTTLPGSLAIMFGGCLAIGATVWRTRLLAELANRVDVQTAEFQPPAGDTPPAQRVFNPDPQVRQVVRVLSPAEETWRLKLVEMANLMPERQDTFTVREWTPAENGFSRGEWDQTRAELVARGWLDNKSQLTFTGRAVMADWRANPHGATITSVARALAT